MAGKESESGARTVEAAVRLYAAPLGEFVAARKALSIELRAKGHKEEAAAVASLRKPSRAAWGLGEVARRHPGAMRRLLEETAEARRAQTAAVSRRDAEALRESSRRWTAEIGKVVDLAMGSLQESAGAGAPAVRQTMVQTLRALASADESVIEALARGTLATDLDPSGDFGVFGDVTPTPRTRELRGAGPPDEGGATSTPARSPREGGHPEAAAKAPRDAGAKARARAQRDADAKASAKAQRDAEAKAKREAEEAEARAHERAKLAEAAETAEKEAQRLEREAEAAARHARDAERRAAAARREADHAKKARDDFRG
jgi:hypothetical protein